MFWGVCPQRGRCPRFIIYSSRGFLNYDYIKYIYVCNTYILRGCWQLYIRVSRIKTIYLIYFVCYLRDGVFGVPWGTCYFGRWAAWIANLFPGILNMKFIVYIKFVMLSSKNVVDVNNGYLFLICLIYFGCYLREVVYIFCLLPPGWSFRGSLGNLLLRTMGCLGC